MPPDTEGWRELAAAEQHAADRTITRRSTIPDEPGVYLWRHDREIVYVGVATRSLRDRLSTHRGRGPSLSGSALRRNVAAHLHGIPPARTGKGRERLTASQLAATNDWIRDSTIAWVTCADDDAADALETMLLTQWKPPLNRA